MKTGDIVKFKTNDHFNGMIGTIERPMAAGDEVGFWVNVWNIPDSDLPNPIPFGTSELKQYKIQ